MAFEELQKETNERRREALEAMASSGSDGVAAYQQAQASVQAQADEALAHAAGDAGVGYSEGYEQRQLANTIGAPLTQAQSRLSARQADFESDIARQAASLGGYLDKISGSIPLYEAQIEADMAAARAAAAASYRGGGGGGGSSSSSASTSGQYPGGASGMIDYAYGTGGLQRDFAVDHYDAALEAALASQDPALRAAAENAQSQLEAQRATQARNAQAAQTNEARSQFERAIGSNRDTTPARNTSGFQTSTFSLSPDAFNNAISAAENMAIAQQALAEAAGPSWDGNQTNAYSSAVSRAERAREAFEAAASPTYIRRPADAPGSGALQPPGPVPNSRTSSGAAYTPTRGIDPVLYLESAARAAQRDYEASFDQGEIDLAMQQLADVLLPNEIAAMVESGRLNPDVIADRGTELWEWAYRAGIEEGFDPGWLAANINQYSDMERAQDRLDIENDLIAEELRRADLARRQDFAADYGFETPGELLSDINGRTGVARAELAALASAETNIPVSADDIELASSILRAPDEFGYQIIVDPVFQQSIEQMALAAIEGRGQEEAIARLSASDAGQALAATYGPAWAEVIREFTDGYFSARISPDDRLNVFNPAG